MLFLISASGETPEKVVSSLTLNSRLINFCVRIWSGSLFNFGESTRHKLCHKARRRDLWNVNIRISNSFVPCKLSMSATRICRGETLFVVNFRRQKVMGVGYEWRQVFFFRWGFWFYYVKKIFINKSKTFLDRERNQRRLNLRMSPIAIAHVALSHFTGVDIQHETRNDSLGYSMALDSSWGK